MKRLRSLGLCLVGVVVLGAILASGVQAAKTKPKPITGPIKITSTTKEAELSTAPVTVKCKKGTDVGEVNGPKTGNDTVTFEECEALEKKCQSEGAPAGVIKTFELENELGWISKEKEEVGIDFKPGPENAKYLAEFKCEGLGVKVSGSVIGRIGPLNKMGVETSEDFTGEGVTQDPTKFEGEPEDTLRTFTTLSGNEGLKSLQKVEGTTKDDEVEGRKDPAEIRTLGGSPEFGRCQVHKAGHYEDSNCTKEKFKEAKGKKKYDGKYEWEPV
jgi:hypothetical protein